MQSFFAAADILDCVNECANARFKVCHMFAFVSGVCYLGRTDVSNGTVVNKPSNVTIYSINGKRSKNKTFLKVSSTLVDLLCIGLMSNLSSVMHTYSLPIHLAHEWISCTQITR